MEQAIFANITENRILQALELKCINFAFTLNGWEKKNSFFNKNDHKSSNKSKISEQEKKKKKVFTKKKN